MAPFWVFKSEKFISTRSNTKHDDNSVLDTEGIIPTDISGGHHSIDSEIYFTEKLTEAVQKKKSFKDIHSKQFQDCLLYTSVYTK